MIQNVLSQPADWFWGSGRFTGIKVFLNDAAT